MESILVNHSSVKAELINARGQRYPSITISNDRIVKQTLALDEKFADFYVEKKFNLALNLYNQLQKKGFFYTLEQIKSFIKFKQTQSLQNNENDFLRFSWIFSTVLALISVIFWFKNVCCLFYFYFYPTEKLTDNELIIRHHSNFDWKDGILREFSWHPRQCRCALALSNDLVFVFSSDYKRPINHSIGLKHIQQRNITSIDWHPKCDFILAIACLDKILIWTLDSSIEKFIPDPNTCVKTVNTPLGSPLNSVRFHPDGHLLAACSSRCSAIFLLRFEWKSSKEYSFTQSIHRIFFSPPFTNLAWSPDGNRLVAQTASPKLVIFETFEWSNRTVTSNLNEACQTLAWSLPKSKFLIYSEKKSSKIFALPFYDKADKGYVGGDRRSMLLVDLADQIFEDEPTGKEIQDFVWSRDSTILVVLFKDKPNVLGVYGTSIRSLITIWPLFTIKAHFEDISVFAQLIKFHNSYVDNGSSLLSVCWSNGVVSNLPLQNQCEVSSENSPRSLIAVCKSFTSTPIRGGDTNMNRTGHLNKSSVVNASLNSSVISSNRKGGLFSTRLHSNE